MAACRDPKNHRYTPGRRPARAAGGHRRQDQARLRLRRAPPANVLVTNGGKHAVFNAFAALLRPGRRGDLPGAVLDDLPRVDHPGRRRAGGDPDRRGRRVPGHRRAARGGPHRRAPRCSLFVSPDNPSGAVYPPEEVEAIGRWAVEHGLWVVTDEIYEHLVYERQRVHVDAGAGARAGRHLPRRQRRGQDLRHDRLAGGLDDRPERRRRPRRPTSSPTPRRTWPTSPSGPPWPPSPATSTRWR